jgi:hypothetical protein
VGDIVMNLNSLLVKYQLFLSDFFTKLRFSRHIFEKFSNIYFVIICPVGTDSFYADRWTHVTKITYAPKNRVTISNKGRKLG